MSVQLFNGSHNPESVEIITFPGGEPHVKGHPESDHVVIDVRAGCADDIMSMLVLNDFLRRQGVKRVDLFIPYFPGARQDRDAPLTVKVYADLINSAAFDKVVIVDPHSDVAPALIDRVQVIPITEVFKDNVYRDIVWHPDSHVLICPDQGAGKRVEAVAARFGYEVVYARKHRDMQSGALSGFSCDPIPAGKQAIVVDDICDGGGTFIGLANTIRQQRPTALHLWVTHGIFSKGTRKLLEYYSTIRTTDSFPIKDMLEVNTLYTDIIPLESWRLI